MVLQIGTNNLKSTSSAQDIAAKIIRLDRNMKKDWNEIIILSRISRRDKWNGKACCVNNELQNLCSSFDIGLLDTTNINNSKDLNRGEGLT